MFQLAHIKGNRQYTIKITVRSLIVHMKTSVFQFSWQFMSSVTHHVIVFLWRHNKNYETLSSHWSYGRTILSSMPDHSSMTSHSMIWRHIFEHNFIVCNPIFSVFHLISNFLSIYWSKQWFCAIYSRMLDEFIHQEHSKVMHCPPIEKFFEKYFEKYF